MGEGEREIVNHSQGRKDLLKRRRIKKKMQFDSKNREIPLLK